MALGLKVYGETVLKFAFPVTSGNPTFLDIGFSKEGFKVTFDHEYEDVLTDNYGTKVPLDVQFMGCSAKVEGEIVLFDESNMYTLIEHIMGPTSFYSGNAEPSAPGSEITPRQPGTLYRHSDRMVELKLESQSGGVISFKKALLTDPTEFNLSTKNSVYKLNFKCFPHNRGNSSPWYTIA